MREFWIESHGESKCWEAWCSNDGSHHILGASIHVIEKSEYDELEKCKDNWIHQYKYVSKAHDEAEAKIAVAETSTKDAFHLLELAQISRNESAAKLAISQEQLRLAVEALENIKAQVGTSTEAWHTANKALITINATRKDNL